MAKEAGRKTATGAIVGVLIVFAVIALIFFEMFSRQVLLFRPHVLTPPPGAVQPMGKSIPFSADDIALRKKYADLIVGRSAHYYSSPGVIVKLPGA